MLKLKASDTIRKIIGGLNKFMFSRISMLPISVFRIYWGAMMGKYFFELLTDRGEFRYFDTIFHFRYSGFEFIPVIGDTGLYIVFTFGLVSGVMMCLGLYYRLISKILFTVYLYVLFIDQAYYNNHYYFYALVNLFWCFVPAEQELSIDKMLNRSDSVVPERWMLLLFQLQICIVYFYGGLSKLANPGWLKGLAADALYGNAFTDLGIEFSDAFMVAYTGIITWGGLLFDLLVPFALMTKTKWIKTLGVAGVVLFNVSNAVTFLIGTFPYTMLAGLLLFLWPQPTIAESWPQPAKGSYRNSAVKLLFGIYFAFQLLFPLRHLLIEGNVFWTSEGKMWSWHMMSGGSAVACFFFLDEHDDDGAFIRSHKLDPSRFLNSVQVKNLGLYPFCIPQFARFIKKEAELAGMTNVKVYADIIVVRNGKQPRFKVSPKQELSSIEYSNSLKHDDWILLYKKEDHWMRWH
jgi:hypothetical protein